MVAINFQKQFKPLIMDGSKPHTIRARWSNGKIPWKPQCKLQLYIGLRTVSTELLRTETCTAVIPIAIETSGPYCSLFDYRNDPKNANMFAKNDGFENYMEMLLFFEKQHGLPVDAFLICWLDSEKLYMTDKTVVKQLHVSERTGSDG